MNKQSRTSFVTFIALFLISCKNPEISSGVYHPNPTSQPTMVPTHTAAANSGSRCLWQNPQPYGESLAVSPDLTYAFADGCADNSPYGRIPDGPPPFRDAPSPNFDSRAGQKISGIVLHNTVSRFDGAVSWLRTPSAKVSAHIVISRNGEIARLVADEFAAWHSKQVNKATLGVELEAYAPGQGLADAQERVLLQQLKFWSKRYGITASQISNHRDHVSTQCPSYIWPTKSDFLQWRNASPL